MYSQPVHILFFAAGMAALLFGVGTAGKGVAGGVQVPFLSAGASTPTATVDDARSSSEVGKRGAKGKRADQQAQAVEQQQQ